MVTLVKLKKTDEYIEANYVPEDTQEEGCIKMRLSDGEVVERQLTPSDELMKWYFIHARNELRRIIEEGSEPERRVVMWY